MQNANGLIEQAKTTRAWLGLVRAQGALAQMAGQAQPALTSAGEAPLGLGQMQSELLAELNSPPQHRIYSQIMKKHDAVHPRR